METTPSLPDSGSALVEPVLQRDFGAEAGALCCDATCRPQIYRLARSLVGDPDDAEDCRQEVCLRCLRKANTFRGDAERSTWLYRVTKNVCLDFLRKSRRRRDHEEAESSGETMPTAPRQGRAEQDGAPPSVPDSVRMTLSQLTPREREALVLKYLEGRSHSEIAQQLGVSYRSAQQTVYRARIAFRRAYGVLGEPGPSERR